MPDDILAALSLTAGDISTLPAKTRNSLIAYLIRWEHYEAAHACLQQLLTSHSHLVSVYDNLARVYLAQDQPNRALEIMRQRQTVRTSTTSQALVARIHLVAKDHTSAKAIARELVSEHPYMLNSWRLQTDVSLSALDYDGAEAALK